MTHHVGTEFHNRTFRLEWRVSMGFFRRRVSSDFGIRPDDPNPYQSFAPALNPGSQFQTG